MPEQPELAPIRRETVQLRVITSPRGVELGAAGSFETTDEISIGIEDTNRRDAHISDCLLPPRLAEQVLGCECRRLVIVLFVENRRFSSHPASHGPKSG